MLVCLIETSVRLKLTPKRQNTSIQSRLKKIVAQNSLQERRYCITKVKQYSYLDWSVEICISRKEFYTVSRRTYNFFNVDIIIARDCARKAAKDLSTQIQSKQAQLSSI